MFRIDAKKKSASCGGDVIDPWRFDVRFSRDHSTLYWVQNRAPISGAIAADRTVKIDTSASTIVRPATKTAAACSVTRADSLTAALGPDEPLGDAGTGGFSSASGTLTYAFSADEGSDCADLADPNLSVLPCAIVYSFNATKVGP